MQKFGAYRRRRRLTNSGLQSKWQRRQKELEVEKVLKRLFQTESDSLQSRVDEMGTYLSMRRLDPGSCRRRRSNP